MKKVLLCVMIVVLLTVPFALTACSNVSQRSLLMTALVCDEDGSELFTYKVYHPTVQEDKTVDYGDPVGTMTMEYEHLSKKTVQLPSETAEEHFVTYGNVSYDLLTMKLTMDNGDTIDSYVVYSTIGLNPVYSHTRSVINGKEKIMQVNYGNGKYLHALRYEDGKKVNDYRHERSGCYDDAELYALIRSSKIAASSYSLSFTTVSALLGTETDISVSRKGSAVPTLGYALAENERCFVFSIGTDNSYAGSYQVAITEHPVTVEDINGTHNVKKVIHTIQEREYVYALDSITLKTAA